MIRPDQANAIADQWLKQERDDRRQLANERARRVSFVYQVKGLNSFEACEQADMLRDAFSAALAKPWVLLLCAAVVLGTLGIWELWVSSVLVNWSLPLICGGVLAYLVRTWFVRKELKRVVQFRRECRHT